MTTTQNLLELIDTYAEAVAEVYIANSEVWRSPEYRAKRVAERDADREAVVSALAASAQATQATNHPGPSGDRPSDFQEGQWWLKKLDEVAAAGTDDFKRAVAVVRNMMRTMHAQATQAGEPVAWQYAFVNRPDHWFPVHRLDELERLKTYSTLYLRPLYTHPAPTTAQAVEPVTLPKEVVKAIEWLGALSQPAFYADRLGPLNDWIKAHPLTHPVPTTAQEAEPARKPLTEYCWSLAEDESFTGSHDSVEGALAEAQDDLIGNFEPGEKATVYVGEATPALSYLKAEWVGEWVCEHLDEYLWDNHVAADDPIIKLDKAGNEALGRIVIDWLDTNANIWRYGVENIKPYEVIVEDRSTTATQEGGQAKGVIRAEPWLKSAEVRERLEGGE